MFHVEADGHLTCLIWASIEEFMHVQTLEVSGATHRPLLFQGIVPGATLKSLLVQGDV